MPGKPARIGNYAVPRAHSQKFLILFLKKALTYVESFNDNAGWHYTDPI